jgi:hypothetical protein
LAQRGGVEQCGPLSDVDVMLGELRLAKHHPSSLEQGGR